MATSPRDAADRRTEELRRSGGGQQESTWYVDRTTCEVNLQRQHQDEPVETVGSQTMRGGTIGGTTQTASRQQGLEQDAVAVDLASMEQLRTDMRTPMRDSRYMAGQADSGEERPTPETLDMGTATSLDEAEVYRTSSTTALLGGPDTDASTAMREEDLRHNAGADSEGRLGEMATIADPGGQDHGDQSSPASYQKDPGNEATEVDPSGMVDDTAADLNTGGHGGPGYGYPHPRTGQGRSLETKATTMPIGTGRTGKTEAVELPAMVGGARMQ